MAAAPTITFGSRANGTGAVTYTIPSHAVGDLLLLFIETAGNQAAANISGWSIAPSSPANTQANTSGTRLTVHYRIAVANNTTNPQIADPGDHQVGVAAVVKSYGGNTATAFGNTTSSIKTTASTSLSITGVTTVYANSLVLYAASRDNDAGGASFSNQAGTNLSSLAEAFDDGSTAGNGGGIGVWKGTLAANGATGTLTANVASSQNAFWVAEIPAVGAQTYTQNTAGTLTSAGSAKKAAAKSLAGTLAASGTLATTLIYSQSLAGTLTMNGSMFSNSSKVLMGTLTTNGAIAKAITHPGLAGTLTSSGGVSKRPTKVLAGGMGSTPGGSDPENITATYKSNIYSTTDTTSYQAGTSWEPSANSLLLAFVIGSSTANANPTSVQGHGVSYTLFANLACNFAADYYSLSVWVAKSDGTTNTSAANATWASNRTAGVVVEYEVTGVDLSGTAAEAIASSNTAYQGGFDETFSINIGNAASANNRTVAFIWSWTDYYLTNGAGYTLGSKGSLTGSPYLSAMVEHKTDSFSNTATASAGEGTSFMGAMLELKAFNGGGGAATYAMSGALANKKTAGAALAGTLTSNGSVAKASTKSLAGTFTPTGGLILAISKALAGTLTSAGEAITQYIEGGTEEELSLSGTLTPTGGLVKSVGKVAAGTLTSAGAVVRLTGKRLDGTLTSAGSVLKTASKSATGTLTSAGSVLKATSKSLLGALTPNGGLILSISKALAGVLTSAGDALTQKTTGGPEELSLSGALTPTGAFVRAVGKGVGGTLTSAGSLVRASGKKLDGTLTSAGSVVRATSKTLDGTLPSAGNIGKAVNKLQTLAGSLVFDAGQGNVAYDDFDRANTNPIGGNWAHSSNVTNFTHDGQIINNRYTTASNGDESLNYWNATAFSNDQFSQATITSTTSSYHYLMVRAANNSDSCYYLRIAQANNVSIRLLLNGSVNTIATNSSITFANGDIFKFTVVGNVLTGYKNGVAVVTGNNSTLTTGQPGLGGYYSTTYWDDWSGGDVGGGSGGSLLKSAAKLTAGTLTSTGAVLKGAAKSVAGTLTPVADIATTKPVAPLSLAGVLVPTGQLIKQSQKALSGVLTSAGNVGKGVTKAFAATLDSIGGLRKHVGTFASGTLTSAGTMVRQQGTRLGGVLASSGTLVRNISQSLRGTLRIARVVFRGRNETIQLRMSYSPWVALKAWSAQRYYSLTAARTDTISLTSSKGTPMTQQNFTIHQGTLPTLVFTIDPLENVSAWTTSFILTNSPKDTVALLTKAGSPSANLGVTTVSLTTAETRGLAQRQYNFVFARTNTGYEQVLATGTVTVTAGIV